MPATSDPDLAVARLAAAIGEPARARMLYCLMEGRARTSTELALVAEVTPATASTHLARLRDDGLVRVVAQGRHRYYALTSAHVARVLESLNVLAGAARGPFAPTTPQHLRAARTCYDHIAGTLGVALHDRLVTLEWIARCGSAAAPDAYDVTDAGAHALGRLGIDVDAVRQSRRRFAFGCLDWSERRAHLGGAVGAELLGVALDRRWIARERDSRALRVTPTGTRELAKWFGVRI